MNKILPISTIVLSIILILMFVQKCGDNKEKEMLRYRIGSVQDSIQIYKDETGRAVEMQRIFALENIEEVEGLKKELERLKIKKASAYLKYKSEFSVDTMLISFKDSLPCYPFIEPFDLDSNFIKFHGVVTNKKLNIYNLKVPNEMVIVIGEKKHSWYKFAKDTVSVFVQNSNQHIQGKQLEPYVFTPKEKFYNTLWFKGVIFGAGILGGAYLMK